eukprot:SAG11_NODE_4931_length_1719_cov_1.133333_1_plen_69_part_00
MGNMTNKGAVFLELIEHPVVNELCGYVLGRSILTSLVTGHYFCGQEPTPRCCIVTRVCASQRAVSRRE